MRLVSVMVNGKSFQGREGETVASLVARLGKRVLRETRVHKEPRGIFCGMGLCHDCLVTVNGNQRVRACITLVEADMEIQTATQEELEMPHDRMA